MKSAKPRNNRNSSIIFKPTMRRKETDGVIKSSHGKKLGVGNEDESAKKVFSRK